jgi:hypothetical protein
MPQPAQASRSAGGAEKAGHGAARRALGWMA